MAKAKAPAKKAPPAKKPEGPPKSKKVDFPIDQISFHPELQARIGDSTTPIGGLYGDHLEDLTRAVKDGIILPRVRLWTVPGKGNFCTDGHHTTEAYKRAGKKEVPVELFTGEWVDAVLDSTSANRHEGAPKKLTNVEKRRNVKHTLKVLAESGQKWSNNKIAKHCRVGDDLVASIIEDAAPKPKAVAEPNAKPSETKAPPYTEEERDGPVHHYDEPPPHISVPVTTLPIPSAPTMFDAKKLEEHMGAVYRDIDECARSFGESTAARTDNIRHLAQDFKKEFLDWMKELVLAKGKK